MKPAGTASRSPCQPQRNVPPFRPMVCSWNALRGATRSVRPSSRVSSRGQPVGGRWGRRNQPSSDGPALLGSAELAVLEDEGAQALRCLTFDPFGWE